MTINSNDLKPTYDELRSMYNAQCEAIDSLIKKAKKIGGSYQGDGYIVACFKTTTGQTRYVFEFEVPKGMLHIFSPEQVEVMD